MGTQKGALRIEGNVGNLSFFKDSDGHKVRIKSGPSGDKMRTDKRFARTRQNWAEFARAAGAAKLLRKALAEHVKRIRDRYSFSRLLKATLAIVKSDSTHDRGERLIWAGDLSLLRGFEFNKDQELSRILDISVNTSIDRAAGTATVQIPQMVPFHAIDTPDRGVTHIRFVAAAAEIDWEENTFVENFIEGDPIPYNHDAAAPQTLSLTLPPDSTKTLVLSMGIWFFQEVNGKYWHLLNGSKNAMALVGIDTP